MASIASKISKLPIDKRKEVEDFIDFLLKNRDTRKESMENWRKKILKISEWSEAEIEELEDRIHSNSNWGLHLW